ncbi:uncharacterized protein LOC109827045 [Asparagus officinalis]|uniref:uncharacterized protein LOC109827045 n=1 Tax=Asparagus officinalis TaxID=4686 RepID=UPI00098E3FF4|nr:uncharacterized protein LOC109827045 [Asparagus officinalis]
MLSFLHRIRNSNKLLFHYKQGSNPSTAHLRFISKVPAKPRNDQSSLTISYLTNSCGLSPQSALSVAKKIQLKTTKNADSVLNLLKSHSFTDTQITKLITKSPALLLSNVENTLKPKIDFFTDTGFSSSEFASLACCDPIIFRSNLQNRIKPNFELINSILGDNKKLLVAFRRSSRLFSNDLETNFLPNVRTLQSYGVPTTNIAKLITLYPRVLTNETKQFATTVESIKKFGFNPLTCLFVQAVYVVSATTPLTWESKSAVYKSLGWSEGEIISAFTKQPFCLLLSEKKIRKMVDFYVKKLHWEPCFLAANPKFLGYSLEKRVLPRCCVLSVLSSKSLIRRYPHVNHRDLSINECKFYNKYVGKYMDQVPEVIEAYKSNLEFVEFDVLC